MLSFFPLPSQIHRSYFRSFQRLFDHCSASRFFRRIFAKCFLSLPRRCRRLCSASISVGSCWWLLLSVSVWSSSWFRCRWCRRCLRPRLDVATFSFNCWTVVTGTRNTRRNKYEQWKVELKMNLNFELCVFFFLLSYYSERLSLNWPSYKPFEVSALATASSYVGNPSVPFDLVLFSCWNVSIVNMADRFDSPKIEKQNWNFHRSFLEI